MIHDDIHRNRLKLWPSRRRARLLRRALGRDTFEYMLRTIKWDERTPAARQVDIVIRQDGVEKRIEADWIKTIARITYHLPSPACRVSPKWLQEVRCWWRSVKARFRKGETSGMVHEAQQARGEQS